MAEFAGRRCPASPLAPPDMVPESLLSRVPPLADLVEGLTTVLEERAVSITERRPQPYATSFPCEIVTCTLVNGRVLRLFCKYGVGARPEAFGHRSGVEYEAAVYRQVLRPLSLSTAGCYGAYRHPATGETWLVLEDLSDCLRIGQAPVSEGMLSAARWLAEFHRTTADCLKRTGFEGLRAYDASYYRGWAKRTLDFSRPLHSRLSWLPSLCEQFAAKAADILRGEPTIVHGEFYSKNILYCAGVVRPVDWESTAVAVGEIDLAALVERWPTTVAEACAGAYYHQRWAGALQPGEVERLGAGGRLYLQMRWLGERPDWTLREDHQWRFGEMLAAGQALGLV